MLGVCGAGLLLVATGDLASRAAATPASGTGTGTGPSRAWLTAGLTRLGLLLAVAAVSLPLRFGSVIDSITAIAVLSVSLLATIQGPFAGLIGFRPPRKPTMAADHCLPLPSAGDQRAAGLSAPVSPLPAVRAAGTAGRR
jgi:hypothetical protein